MDGSRPALRWKSSMIDRSGFESKPQTLKGTYAEDIVREYLRLTRGYQVYRPDFPGAHVLDKFVISPTVEVFGLDVKAKAKRKYYPDTGINVGHYRRYCKVMETVKDFILAFVDEEEGVCYGGFLSELNKARKIENYYPLQTLEYPRVEGGIIYFPRDAMEKFFDLSEDQIKELKRLTTKKDSYLPG